MNLKRKGIGTASHYIPLHLSEIGHRYGYKKGDLPITESVSETLLRLPLYESLEECEIDYIIRSIKETIK